MVAIPTLALALLAAGVTACFSERVSEPDVDEVCTSSATTRCLVEMTDNAFSPSTIRVTAGSIVAWENQGAAPHTTTGDAWDSGSLSPSQGFERPFPTAGTFDYVCVFHPGMEGTVVVE